MRNKLKKHIFQIKKEKDLIVRFNAVHNFYSFFYHKKLELKKTKNCNQFLQYKKVLEKLGDDFFKLSKQIIDKAELQRIDKPKLFFSVEGIDLIKRAKVYLTYTKLFFFTKNSHINC